LGHGMVDKKDARVFEILSEFGLTENQSKVFVAAVQLGTPTVSELADHADVRREEVYRMLPDLEKLGLIERMLGKPMRIKSPNPSTSISRLVKHEQSKAKKRINALASQTSELLKGLDHPAQAIEAEEELREFSLIQEREGIRISLDEMIERTSKRIDLLLTRQDLTWLLSSHGEALRRALSRGVHVRLISQPPTGRDHLPKIIQRRFPEDAHIELKYVSNPRTYFVKTDESVLLLTAQPGHMPSSPCLWTNNPSLVALAERDFDERWHESAHWKTVEGVTMAVSPQQDSHEPTSIVHRILLYRTPEARNKVLHNFLRRRTKEGHIGVYVCAEERTGEVKNELAESGFSKASIEKGREFRVLSWEGWLLGQHEFNVEKAIDSWDDLYFEAQDEGFDGVAVVFEMDFFYKGGLVAEMLEYEETLQSMMDGKTHLKCAHRESDILALPNPLQVYGRLLNAHTAVLKEESLPDG
jgi:sugar-specific transcriptional regulator TrmB